MGIKISELNRAASLNNGDLFVLSQVDEQAETGYTSVSTPVSNVAQKMLKEVSFPTDLETSKKTTLSAINEVNQKYIELNDLLDVVKREGKTQFLTTDKQINGGYYAISSQTGELLIISNNDYRRWSEITGLKAGTYSYKRLTTGYTVFKYADGTLHKLRDFSTSSSGTVTIPQDFTLYATAGTNYPYTDNMFCNDSSIPSEYVQGEYVKHIFDSESIFSLNAINFNNTVRTIAHRGDFLIAPQCTRISYIIARRRGIMIAENDLNITSDGQYVMYHGATLKVLGDLVDLNGYQVFTDGTNFYFYDSADNILYNEDYTVSSASVATLTRCNGTNYNISDLPFSFLRKLSFGAYKDIKYLSEQILTFAEWVLLCKQLGMDIYIDRKITYTDAIISDLFTIVRRYGMLDNSTWIGLTSTQASYVRTNLDSNARFCKLAAPTQALITEWQSLNQSGRGVMFNPDAKTVTQSEIQLGLDNGFQVECYYADVTDKTEYEILSTVKQFISYGVQGMTIDHYRVADAFRELFSM